MVTREATGQFRGEGPGEVEAMGRDRLEVERVCEFGEGLYLGWLGTLQSHCARAKPPPHYVI
jgi:hypothetical protein